MGKQLKAPFAWFGGKSRVSGLVWQRFGDTLNYVEPFAGSLAVLLQRPHWSVKTWRFSGKRCRTETVNDLDCYLANFWRSVRFSADEVANYADWPVNECDLHARHRWLVNQNEFRDNMRSDPDFFDAKIAGWWVWGISMWIGGGWCDGKLHQQRPELKRSAGIHRARVPAQRPHLSSSNGVHSRRRNIQLWIDALSARLRGVRVCCGNWNRIMGPSPTYLIGTTGVLLDPPYPKSDGRDMGIYVEDSDDVAHEVRRWAIENGDNPKLRIAYCGYEGQKMPSDWEEVAWKANGGYKNRSGNNVNATRERIWFSPHCLKVDTMTQGCFF